VGNRTSVTEGTGRTANWTYDKIYRLTNETIGADPANKDGSVGYVLDPVGNRKSSTSTLSGVNPESFNYTVDDELTTDNYDNNGNTTGSGVNSFTYDSENELKTMNGSAVTLLYDGDGNRVAKTVGSVTTRYLIDDLNPTGLPQVVEETVNGAVTRQYTYGLQLISENQLVSNTWTASFYETDGTGSVRQLTNSLGQVTDTYEYDAFGNTISKTTLPTGATPTPNNYLYRGEQFDPDLSLYYLRARYYNAGTGRFLSSDPLAGEGERRYEYAAADPVNGLDPTGDAAMIEFELINMRGSMSVSYPSLPPWCKDGIVTQMKGYLPYCNKHEVTVSMWPLGAKRFGHVGVAVDSNDTLGWATVQHWVMHGPVQAGIPVPGILKDDLKTYPGKPHSYIHIEADKADADAMQQAINNRMPPYKGVYDLYANNCAQFVEDVLHAGNVAGVPGHEVFEPKVLWWILTDQDGY
jgi:RHS repeat-associated protein